MIRRNPTGFRGSILLSFFLLFFTTVPPVFRPCSRVRSSQQFIALISSIVQYSYKDSVRSTFRSDAPRVKKICQRSKDCRSRQSKQPRELKSRGPNLPTSYADLLTSRLDAPIPALPASHEQKGRPDLVWAYRFHQVAFEKLAVQSDPPILVPSHPSASPG